MSHIFRYLMKCSKWIVALMTESKKWAIKLQVVGLWKKLKIIKIEKQNTVTTSIIL